MLSKKHYIVLHKLIYFKNVNMNFLVLLIIIKINLVELHDQQVPIIIYQSFKNIYH